MTKVSASRLKARLGRYMQDVRDGQEIVVTDRDRPVARIVPVKGSQRDELPAISNARDPSAPPLGQVRVRGLRRRDTDTTALLAEDRGRR